MSISDLNSWESMGSEYAFAGGVLQVLILFQDALCIFCHAARFGLGELLIDFVIGVLIILDKR